MPRPDSQPVARVAFNAAGAVKAGFSGRPPRPAGPVGVGSPHKPLCSPSQGNGQTPGLCLRATVRRRQLAGGFRIRLPLADAIREACATGRGVPDAGISPVAVLDRLLVGAASRCLHRWVPVMPVP